MNQVINRYRVLVEHDFALDRGLITDMLSVTGGELNTSENRIMFLKSKGYMFGETKILLFLITRFRR
jgi:hypothetical protein